MAVRSIQTVRSLVDLGLSEQLRTLLKDVDPQELLDAARHGDLMRYLDIDATRAKKILEELDQAGFIFHENPISQAMRRLCFVINPKRSKYEERKEFTAAQIAEAKQVIGALPAQEAWVISMRFGLDGGGERSQLQCANYLHVTPPRASQIEAKALRKLRLPNQRQQLNRALGLWPDD